MSAVRNPTKPPAPQGLDPARHSSERSLSGNFELTAQKLVYGGKALGYHQGRAVLVARAWPGERLLVEATRVAKGVVHARPVKVLEPAPTRVAPPCPYFGRCGGCHYQHISSEHQLTAKIEILRETFRRIGKINWEAEIPARIAAPWNYRNQAQFKVGCAHAGQVTLGFFEAESHRLLPIEACLILSPRLNEILRELQGGNWASWLAPCREVELLADHRDSEVMLILRGTFGQEEGEALARKMLGHLPGVVSAAIESGGEYCVFGKPALCYAVGEFQYQVSPGSFFQASRYLIPELIPAVLGNESGALAIDLYAGVGLFTLPLARRFSQVVGVEAHPKSVSDLTANARTHHLANIRPVRQTVFDFLGQYGGEEPDLVVFDPPRAGAGRNSLGYLAKLRPRRIHYVSCYPPTLARDLAYLIAQGYQLDSVELLELFPQTFHIESLVRLRPRAN